EEIFGPLAAYVIMQNDDKTVKIANSTGYGLSATSFTKNVRKRLAITKRLESE
ncbi:hypothetical protein K469DRAFT_590940, partial [Zopfia rhizophila CBS 207.26]